MCPTPMCRCAHDQCQSATVTPAVNLSFSFLSRVSRHLIDFIAIDSKVRKVVSALAVFRLVHDLKPRLCLPSLKLFTGLMTISIGRISTSDTGSKRVARSTCGVSMESTLKALRATDERDFLMTLALV